MATSSSICRSLLVRQQSKGRSWLPPKERGATTARTPHAVMGTTAWWVRSWSAAQAFRRPDIDYVGRTLQSDLFGLAGRTGESDLRLPLFCYSSQLQITCRA